MKIEIATHKASRLINCGQIILITSAYQDKKTITPCAWHMPLSKEPSLVAVALAKKHFSSHLIQQSKEFIINIPSWRLLDKVVLCGAVTGSACDKFSYAGFHSEQAHALTVTPAIAEALGTLECSVYECNQVGDHYMFIATIKYAQAESKFFVNDMWDTRAAELIFHVGGSHFFPSQAHSEFKK